MQAAAAAGSPFGSRQNRGSRRGACLACPFGSIDASASLHTTPHHRALDDRHGARAAAALHWERACSRLHSIEPRRHEAGQAAGGVGSARADAPRGAIGPDRRRLPRGQPLSARHNDGVAAGRWRGGAFGASIDRAGRSSLKQSTLGSGDDPSTLCNLITLRTPTPRHQNPTNTGPFGSPLPSLR